MRVSLIAGVLASAVVVTARTDHNYHQYAFYTQGDDETTQWGLNLDHDDGHAWNAPPPPPPACPLTKRISVPCNRYIERLRYKFWYSQMPWDPF